MDFDVETLWLLCLSSLVIRCPRDHRGHWKPEGVKQHLQCPVGISMPGTEEDNLTNTAVLHFWAPKKGLLVKLSINFQGPSSDKLWFIEQSFTGCQKGAPRVTVNFLVYSYDLGKSKVIIVKFQIYTLIKYRFLMYFLLNNIPYIDFK
jgi:hypothetical protein